MPDQDKNYRYPEDLLVGADRPRPLAPTTRARLEEALTAQRARPLSPEVRGRLENSLRPQGTRRKWGVMVPGLAAAAIIVVVAALVVPGLVHKSTPGSSDALRAPAKSAPASGVFVSRGHKAARQGNATGAHNVHGPGPQAPRPGAVVPASSSLAAIVPPSVNGVSPRSGPAAGNTWVVVTGRGLSGVTAVHFGDKVAVRVDVVSAAEVKALSPAHAAGTVEVIVSGQIRKSVASPADLYTFTP